MIHYHIGEIETTIKLET